jgi:opacity protein-like surface antigen
MRKLLNHWTTKSLILLGVSLAATAVASAQAVETAQRGAEITPFFQTTLLRPDYGPTNNLGYTIGVDYTRFIRSIVQPSLELRVNHAPGLTVGETGYLGGLKLQASAFGIHPYGTFLAGSGTITFTHPIGYYYSDGSFIWSLGGGAEFNVTSAVKLRADFSQQHWNIDPPVLTPMTFSMGVSYSLAFHRGEVR